MKKKFIFMFTFIFVLLTQVCYANGEIEAEILRDGCNVTVSGKIQNISESKVVFLAIGGSDNILVNCQTVSDADGNFTFNIVMPEGSEYGEYPYTLATASLNGILDYSRPAITADIVANGRNITFSGRLKGINGSHTATLVIGSIDNVLYTKQIVSEPDGSFVFNAVMPEDAESGEYSYTISTSADADSLHGTIEYVRKGIVAETSVDGRNVTISGKLEGVNMSHAVMLLVGSVDNPIYSKQIMSEEDGSFVFDAIMPDSAESGEYRYTITTSADLPSVDGAFVYEAVESETPDIPDVPDVPDTPANTYIVSGDEGEHFKIIASAANVTTFGDKIYTLQYDASIVEPVGFFGAQHENFIGTGKKDNVNIISYDSGTITFCMEDIQISEGKSWSGILNVFSFRFKQGCSGTTEIKIY